MINRGKCCLGYVVVLDLYISSGLPKMTFSTKKCYTILTIELALITNISICSSKSLLENAILIAVSWKSTLKRLKKVADMHEKLANSS